MATTPTPLPEPVSTATNTATETTTTTTAVAAPVMTTIDKDLQDSLSALAHKHATISYTLIGVLIFVLLGGAVGAYFAAKWVDREVAQAQVAEKAFTQQEQIATAANTAYQKEVAAHDADRAQWAVQQAQLVQAYTKRNQVVTQQIQQVTQPGKTAQDVYSDLHGAYKDNTTVAAATLSVSTDPITKEQMLTFPVPVVQQFTATKLDDDLQTANVANLNQQLELKGQENDTLTQDVADGKNALAQQVAATEDAKKAMLDYKKIVKPSKFKRIMGGVLKGALFVGGAVLGHYL